MPWQPAVLRGRPIPLAASHRPPTRSRRRSRTPPSRHSPAQALAEALADAHTDASEFARKQQQTRPCCRTQTPNSDAISRSRPRKQAAWLLTAGKNFPRKSALARARASSRKRRRLRQGLRPGSRPSPGIRQAGLFQLLPIFFRHTPSDFVPAWQQICIARDQSKLSNFCKLYCNKVVAKNFAQMRSIWQLACYN